MNKKPKHSKSQSQSSDDTQRLVVWGERREEPDWDTYIAALLAYALREVEDEAGQPEDES
jgi:hypothetical protein